MSIEQGPNQKCGCLYEEPGLVSYRCEPCARADRERRKAPARIATATQRVVDLARELVASAPAGTVFHRLTQALVEYDAARKVLNG